MTNRSALHSDSWVADGDARDATIIEHVARFRITTNEVLRKLFFANQGLAAVRKVTSRLCRHEKLNRFPLRHPRCYFTLGRRAALDRGLPLHRTHSVGPQSLPIEYAVLVYATLGSRYHRRLTRAELRQGFPWLAREHGESPICMDESTNPRVLELLRVDLGGKPDHVARKCHADVQRRLRAKEFACAVEHGRLRLVVVTGTLAKAQVIRAALDQHLWPDGLDLHLAIVNQLPLFMTGARDGA